MRHRNDFSYRLSFKSWRNAKCRPGRLAVGKNKRVFFYRTRFWELHYRIEGGKKRAGWEYEAMKLERTGKRVAYIRHSAWSFHSGEYGMRSWLATKNGSRRIADLKNFCRGGDRSEAEVVAAALGYDAVVDTGLCAFAIE